MFQLLLAVIYLSFISLGLPDSLLGSAWPSMYGELGVPVSYAGAISMIIAAGTIFSSLQSDRLTRALGTGRVTALSVAATAAALFGFSVSRSYAALCLWAIPYGLGAGSVDAALNNYVALHYKSRHMSWLHCMWGVGATLGPYIMGFALSGGQHWSMGYRYVSFLQIALTAVLFLSLPLWKQHETAASANRAGKTDAAVSESEKAASDVSEAGAVSSVSPKALSLKDIVSIPGTKEIMLTFLCYCAVEQTTMLWGSSFLVLQRGLSAEAAASFASLFFIGITLGRAASGFITMRLSDTQMTRLGQAVILLGIAFLFLPNVAAAKAGLALVGLGCAPIYPSIIHATPFRFGADRSQAIIGVEMASAYVGTCLMPPLFGLIAEHVSISLFPVYLLLLLVLMFFMHELTVKRTH